MGLLRSKDYPKFEKSDVGLMQEMLRQFHDFHRGTGLPDDSPSYVAYLPVFALSLLASQEKVERLTKVLAWLTGALVLLTIGLVFLTVLLATGKVLQIL